LWTRGACHKKPQLRARIDVVGERKYQARAVPSRRDSPIAPLAPSLPSKRAAELMGTSTINSTVRIHGAPASHRVRPAGGGGRPDIDGAYKLLESCDGPGMPLFNGGNSTAMDVTSATSGTARVRRSKNRRWAYEGLTFGRGEPVLVVDFVKSWKSGRQAGTVTSEPMMKQKFHLYFANHRQGKQLLD